MAERNSDMVTPTVAALVTGSSKGLGAAISRRLSAEGYHVYITDHIDHESARQTVSGIVAGGGHGEVLPFDVTNESSVRAAINKIQAGGHSLEVLVNNAVTEVAKDIETATLDEWKLVVSTKLDGSWLTTKYALPLLKKASNPNIIFITSADGERPDPDYLAYCTATAGIIAMSRALARSLPRYGVRVNSVSPGPVRTPLWDALGGDDEELWRSLAEKNPLGRVTSPDDVASAVWMLVSDPTRFLNGNTLYVNGGSHLS